MPLPNPWPSGLHKKQVFARPPHLAQSALGDGVLRQMRASMKDADKIAVSPACLAGALALATMAAGNESHRASIARLLGLIESDPAATLARILAGISESASYGSARLAIGNALVVDPLTNPDRAAIELAQACGARVIMQRPSPSVLAQLDDWVTKLTEGKITTLAPLEGEADQYVTSVLHFKGKWSSPFEASATKTEKFTALDGRCKVPMMRGTVPARFHMDRHSDLSQ
jgi:serine protease inhibitor